MLRTRAERWWAVALRGLAAVILGVVALLWPNLTLGALIVLFGIFVLADGAVGIFGLLSGLERSRPWWVQLLEALLSIAAGLVALLWPALTSVALLWVIAVWAIARGLLQVILAVRFREWLPRPWMLGVAGALSLLLGIVFVLVPQAGILSLLWLFGIFAIAHGVLLIARGFYLRDLERALADRAPSRA